LEQAHQTSTLSQIWIYFSLLFRSTHSISGVALGKIYTAGESHSGHLAQGDMNTLRSFTKVVEPKEISKLRFVDIGTGHATMAVLTGRLQYSFLFFFVYSQHSHV
jgi:alpha-tubulin suppressor-like RCC1 family protein